MYLTRVAFGGTIAELVTQIEWRTEFLCGYGLFSSSLWMIYLSITSKKTNCLFENTRSYKVDVVNLLPNSCLFTQSTVPEQHYHPMKVSSISSLFKSDSFGLNQLQRTCGHQLMWRKLTSSAGCYRTTVSRTVRVTLNGRVVGHKNKIMDSSLGANSFTTHSDLIQVLGQMKVHVGL